MQIAVTLPETWSAEVIINLSVLWHSQASCSVAVHRAPLNTFVGLKNGGATCYMNAVFQQLFMQPSIRKMLLAVPELSNEQTDNVFYQMQVIWLHCSHTLCLSSSPAIVC